MEKLIGEFIFFKHRVDKEMKKIAGYKIMSYKIELENEKTQRTNFLLKAQIPALMDINIKFNTKGKNIREIYAELSVKTRETVGENGFLKETIMILKELDRKANINVVPIVYNNDLVFNLYISNIHQGTFVNNKITTIEIFKKLELYNEHKKFIDFYLNADLKKESSKNILKKLSNKEEISFELIKQSARENNDKNKIYPVLYELTDNENLKKEMRYYKYFSYFKMRLKYINIYKEMNKNKLLSDICVLRWLKEELRNPLFANDPHNFDLIYRTEFDTSINDKKDFMVKLETELKKFWQYFEKKINSQLTDKNFKVAIYNFDFLLEELHVKAIGLDNMKPYILKLDNLNQSISDMVEDFIKGGNKNEKNNSKS